MTIPSTAQLEAVRPLVEAAWPSLPPVGDDFLADLRARTQTHELDELHVADLYLCFHCLQGHPAALRAFETHFFPLVAQAVRRLENDGPLADEVAQRLRHKLFVPAAPGVSGLHSYRGHGELRAWFLVSATREALSLRRSVRAEVSLESALLESLPDLETNPEVAHLRGHYRVEFQSAFSEALGALPSGLRAVLRYQLVEHRTLDEIAAIQGVHPVTAARQVTRARETLARETHAVLARRLDLEPLELDSLFRLFQSQVDLSVNRLISETHSKSVT